MRHEKTHFNIDTLDNDISQLKYSLNNFEMIIKDPIHVSGLLIDHVSNSKQSVNVVSSVRFFIPRLNFHFK